MANQFTIGVVNVSMKHDAVSIRDIPARGMPEEEATAAQSATFETMDGWLGNFGFFEFPKAGVIIGKFHWHRPPLVSPYDRLKNAGSTTVTRVGDRWVCPVRAMKIKGKPWPTLCSVTEEELLAFCREKVHERAAHPKHMTIMDELPKTAVGKIFKPDLRRHAITRVYNETLEKNGSPARVVEVIDDKKRGLVAQVALNGADRAEVGKSLDAFTGQWEAA